VAIDPRTLAIRPPPREGDTSVEFHTSTNLFMVRVYMGGRWHQEEVTAEDALDRVRTMPGYPREGDAAREIAKDRVTQRLALETVATASRRHEQSVRNQIFNSPSFVPLQPAPTQGELAAFDRFTTETRREIAEMVGVGSITFQAPGLQFTDAQMDQLAEALLRRILATPAGRQKVERVREAHAPPKEKKGRKLVLD